MCVWESRSGEQTLQSEWLALGIHGDRGDLVQRIGDRREIALGVIAERRGVVQGIGDGGMCLTHVSVFGTTSSCPHC